MILKVRKLNQVAVGALLLASALLLPTAGATGSMQPGDQQPVPIETVSNGCGGAGWGNVALNAQNYLGNTSVYRDSNKNPLARKFTVSFKYACDLHDAGYRGAVVRDRLHGNRIIDFSTWTQKQVDDKFLNDMRLLCGRQIPASAETARNNCMDTGGRFSIGAESRYKFVRKWGKSFFEAARKLGAPRPPTPPPPPPTSSLTGTYQGTLNYTANVPGSGTVSGSAPITLTVAGGGVSGSFGPVPQYGTISFSGSVASTGSASASAAFSCALSMQFSASGSVSGSVSGCTDQGGTASGSFSATRV